MRFNLSLVLSIFLCACQAYNSASQDDQKYQGGDAEVQARAVLANRCGSCHDFYQRSTAGLTSSNYISTGSPANSTLFSRIRGSSVGGQENMPPSGAIGDDEIAKIANWISSL